VLARLTLLASSFFLMPHAITLVAIFTHLCKMYVGVQLLVRLFQLFFMLRASGRSQTHMGAYYFQGRSKSLTPYITPSALANGTAGGRTG
jgi:hypothetical protein